MQDDEQWQNQYLACGCGDDHHISLKQTCPISHPLFHQTKCNKIRDNKISTSSFPSSSSYFAFSANVLCNIAKLRDLFTVNLVMGSYGLTRFIMGQTWKELPPSSI